MRSIRLVAAAAPALLVCGCKAVVLHPSGDVAIQQRDLLLDSTVLMLVIIVPVMLLIVLFAWRYRATNKTAAYEPDWDHSTQLELLIWGAPLLIVICLGALTWMGTHLLDPYRPLDRLGPNQPVAQNAVPLEIEAVALDWKWLFIYPQYGIAAVNELAAPAGRPISFKITSSAVMNSFYIPTLAGQIYAMPGMETSLHAVINKAGDAEGFSANYSGAGFSGMHFAFHGLDSGGFEHWVDGIRHGGNALQRADYLALAKPSENVPVKTYGTVAKGLYDAIVNMCVAPGKMCASQIMAIDAKGGSGLTGIRNVKPLEHDDDVVRNTILGQASMDEPSMDEPSMDEPSMGQTAPAAVGLCKVPPKLAAAAEIPWSMPLRRSAPVRGLGLSPPSSHGAHSARLSLNQYDHF